MSSGGGDSGGPQEWRPRSSNPGGGGGGDAGVDPCVIVERTNLNSPVQVVVQKLKPQDILTLDLQPGDRPRVVVKTRGGEIAGSITSARLVDLVECLGKGKRYDVEILSITGGLVQLEIRPA